MVLFAERQIIKLNDKITTTNLTKNKQNILPKQRESNLELFRIITMMLIVAHHFVVNSGLIAADGPIIAAPTSASSIFLILFGAWGKIGINCFVMITGYFMCKSQITAKKFAKLVGEWLFYRYAIHLVFIVLGVEPVSLKGLIKMIVPITTLSNNFTSCFVVFWLFIPILNRLIGAINERQHLYLLLLAGFTYVFFGTVHRVTTNYVSWFMVIYFIASYIRLYPKKWMSSKLLCGLLLLISMALSAISVIVCAYKGVSLFFFVTDSNTFLAVMVGVFGFLFFKNIRIPYSKFINTVAASTFGVLCIHAHSDNMRQWLWKDTLDNVGHYGDKLMPLYAIGCVIGVFAICTIIDIIRINLLEKPFLKWWDSFEIWLKKNVKKLFQKLNVRAIFSS